MPTRICITLRLWESVFFLIAIFRLTTDVSCCMYSPTMATIIAKQKRRKLYYYVVESARVDGKPRIVKQTYLAPPNASLPPSQIAPPLLLCPSPGWVSAFPAASCLPPSSPGSGRGWLRRCRNLRSDPPPPPI